MVEESARSSHPACFVGLWGFSEGVQALGVVEVAELACLQLELVGSPWGQLTAQALARTVNYT